MGGEVRVIRAPGFDVDYWLCRCHGFRVESELGARGFVEETRFRSRLDRPDLIVVRVGRLTRRLALVPVEEVEEVSPRERVLRVRSLPNEDVGDRLGRVGHRIGPGVHPDWPPKSGV